MKKLILALLFVPLLASAQMMPQQGGTGSSLAPTIGQVLVGLSTGKYTPQATSTLGLMGFAYASSTFLTGPGTATYIPFYSSASVLTSDAHFYYNSTDDVLHVHKLAGDATDGLLIESENGTDIAIIGAANSANVTWYGSHNFSLATQDTIAAFTGAGKTLGSLALATYPSLTELSYVKGVTSAIQSQIDGKVGFSYGTSSYVTVINNQTVAGAKTFSGTTTLATTTVTSFSASGMVGVATTTPTNQVTVASGTIAVLEYDWGSSTSTTMTVDWKKANTQKMNISTSAVTITFVNGTTTPGAQLMLFICNAPSGTAGAITFTHVYWPSATMPTQTTTANNCDLWSFKSTYSTSSNIIIGAQTAKF